MRSTTLQFDYLLARHSLSDDANGITELIDRKFVMQMSRAIFQIYNFSIKFLRMLPQLAHIYVK